MPKPSFAVSPSNAPVNIKRPYFSACRVREIDLDIQVRVLHLGERRAAHDPGIRRDRKLGHPLLEWLCVGLHVGPTAGRVRKNVLGFAIGGCGRLRRAASMRCVWLCELIPARRMDSYSREMSRTEFLLDTDPVKL